MRCKNLYFRNDESSTRTGNGRFQTMTEQQKRADGAFGTISRVSSTADSKTPVCLAGRQLIQPSKSTDPTPDGHDSSSRFTQSQDSIRSRKEERLLLEKYLEEIPSLRGAPDQVKKININQHFRDMYS